MAALTLITAGQNYGKRIMKKSRADSLMFTVYPFYRKLPVEEGKKDTMLV